MQIDDDGDEATPRLVRFQVYDSFGNHVANSTTGAMAGPSTASGLRGSYAWRGQEGSATDAGTNLVYMQNRHYDSEIGRFVKADSLLIASVTTQGMNRFIYTENDPVNKSDPSGQGGFWCKLFGTIFIAAGIAIFVASIGTLIGLTGLTAGAIFQPVGLGIRRFGSPIRLGLHGIIERMIASGFIIG